MTAPAPTGTLAFLFSDIEGSTRLWEQHPGQMAPAVARHDELVRMAIEQRGGYVFSTAGDFFGAAFERIHDALDAAHTVQTVLDAEPWPEPTPIRVRIGVHVGVADERDGDYFGPTLNRLSRIMAAANGGQVLMSEVAARLAGERPKLDLGEHELRDLSGVEHLFQLGTHLVGPPRTLSGIRHNLPISRTPLIGRADEIADVADRLDTARLVTILGLGGAGKTRLAAAAAAETAGRYRDGVWYVDLVPTADVDDVVEAIATVGGLGVGERDPLGELVTRLGGRDVLIVLDNCEHIIDAAAEVADMILDAADGPRLLATSREPLQIDGEVLYGVPPLDSTDDHAPGVALFVDAAARAGYDVDPGELDEVRAVCARLDGLPLAIELAAGQLRQLSVGELASRLEQRLDVLRTNRRGRARRQSSLLDVLDGTWGLLDDDEQLLLQVLAACPGGFGTDDAEQLGAATGLREPLGVLGGLIDRSLVARSADQLHRLLETVKLFARERWADHDDPDRFGELHAQWMLDQLTHRDPEDWQVSTGLVGWASRRYDAHRAAEDWFADHGRLDELGRLIGALTLTYSWEHPQRARLLIERAEHYLARLALPDRAAGDIALTGAGAGLAARRHEAIATLGARAVRHLHVDGEPTSLSMALVIRSWSEVFDDPRVALTTLDDAVAVAHDCGAVRIAVVAEVYRAIYLVLMGDREAALTTLDGIEQHGPTGEADYATACFHWVNACSRVRSDNAAAVDHVDAIADLFRRRSIHQTWGAQGLVAAVVAAGGDIDRTRTELELATVMLRDTTNDDGLPDLLLPYAGLALAVGDLGRARRWLSAVRHAPRPTANFMYTIVYRMLRDEAGLADTNPLDGASIDEIHAECVEWFDSLAT